MSGRTKNTEVEPQALSDCIRIVQTAITENIIEVMMGHP